MPHWPVVRVAHRLDRRPQIDQGAASDADGTAARALPLVEDDDGVASGRGVQRDRECARCQVSRIAVDQRRLDVVAWFTSGRDLSVAAERSRRYVEVQAVDPQGTDEALEISTLQTGECAGLSADHSPAPRLSCRANR